ncbi:hypothetical protein PM082_022629 [Marasmius tenuissimus]|nr:hypothetical protein PM082_022629 [Marasmius tenuissimus]
MQLDPILHIPAPPWQSLVTEGSQNSPHLSSSSPDESQYAYSPSDCQPSRGPAIGPVPSGHELEPSYPDPFALSSPEPVLDGAHNTHTVTGDPIEPSSDSTYLWDVPEYNDYVPDYTHGSSELMVHLNRLFSDSPTTYYRPSSRKSLFLADNSTLPRSKSVLTRSHPSGTPLSTAPSNLSPPYFPTYNVAGLSLKSSMDPSTLHVTDIVKGTRPTHLSLGKEGSRAHVAEDTSTPDLNPLNFTYADHTFHPEQDPKVGKVGPSRTRIRRHYKKISPYAAPSKEAVSLELAKPIVPAPGKLNSGGRKTHRSTKSQNGTLIEGIENSKHGVADHLPLFPCTIGCGRLFKTTNTCNNHIKKCKARCPGL